MDPQPCLKVFSSLLASSSSFFSAWIVSAFAKGLPVKKLYWGCGDGSRQIRNNPSDSKTGSDLFDIKTGILFHICFNVVVKLVL
jgi:hypothetical protein